MGRTIMGAVVSLDGYIANDDDAGPLFDWYDNGDLGWNCALGETGVVAIDPALRTISRWYLYLWGPWFMLGGLAFGAAAWVYVRTSADRRGRRVTGLVGGLGALGLSVTTLLGGIG